MSTSRGTRWRICFWTHRHAMRIRLPAMLCGRDCPCLLAQVSLLRRVSPRVCSRLSMCQNSSPIPLRTIRRPPFSWLKIQRGLRSSAKKLRVTVPPPHCSMAEFLRAIWSERSSICLSDIKRPYPPNIFPFNRSASHKTGLPSNTPDSQNCTVFPAFLLFCIVHGAVADGPYCSRDFRRPCQCQTLRRCVRPICEPVRSCPSILRQVHARQALVPCAPFPRIRGALFNWDSTRSFARLDG